MFVQTLSSFTTHDDAIKIELHVQSVQHTVPFYYNINTDRIRERERAKAKKCERERKKGTAYDLIIFIIIFRLKTAVQLRYRLYG